MRVSDEIGFTNEATALSRTEWIEALCRIADAMTLPSNADLRKAHCKDAAEFMHMQEFGASAEDGSGIVLPTVAPPVRVAARVHGLLYLFFVFARFC